MNAYAWDRANRLLSMGGASHKYDGQGHRVQQTVGATVTKYLLDLQPGLSLVLSQDVGGSVTRHVHAVRGIHAHKDATTNWEYMAQDGLGSVRSVTNKDNGVLWNTNYDGYGNPFGAVGTAQTPYGFTGEVVDGGGLLDVRARRYNPVLGILPSLDPFEGVRDRAMSLNGYSWVEGNVPNAGDPSGRQPYKTYWCQQLSMYYSPELPNGDWNPLYIGGSTMTEAFNDRTTFPPYGYVRSCLLEEYDISLIDTNVASRDTLISEYSRGIYILHDAAVLNYDGGSSWLINRFASALRNSQNFPASSPTIIGGYIEGGSLSATAANQTSTSGNEVVYNFATFQRGEFGYDGPGAAASLLGASASSYLGHVENFAPQGPCVDRDPFAMFVNQYSGASTYTNVGGSVFGLVGAGVLHFNTPPRISNVQGIYGNVVVLSLGRGFPSFPVDVGYGETMYYPKVDTLKSYIDPLTCRVKTSEVVSDIMIGANSPLREYSLNPITLAGRVTAAASAVFAAEVYNSRITDSCSCKCS